MMEILRFVFQSFWHWLGSAILLAIFIKALVGAITRRPIFQINTGKKEKEKDD